MPSQPFLSNLIKSEATDGKVLFEKGQKFWILAISF